MLSNNSKALMGFSAAFTEPRPEGRRLEPINDLLAIGGENSRADVFSQSTTTTLSLRVSYKIANSFEIGMILLPNRGLFASSYSFVNPGNYPV
jgi:hypothetical protein